MSADPLSFFAGEDSSSSESEDGGGRSDLKDSDALHSADTVDNPNKLPSPDTLFATVKKPSFLTNPNQRHVDWDQFVKNDSTEFDESVHLAGGAGGRYSAIAPPKDLDEESKKHSSKIRSSLSAAIINTFSNTGGEISAPPVRYTANEVDPSFRTVSAEAEVPSQQSSKRAGPSLGEGEAQEGGDAQKKQKVGNFRQKEKRKRDLGQTSRGKSYVEEEKRVLRQHFATDEVMN